MHNVYLVPFHAAEQAGAGSFMSAYMDLNDVPATGNHWLLTDVLRKDWGFKGFVVSDALAVASLQTHGYAKDPEDAAYKAVTAGLDMDMASLTYPKYLAGLVRSGQSQPKSQLDACCPADPRSEVRARSLRPSLRRRIAKSTATLEPP